MNKLDTFKEKFVMTAGYTNINGRMYPVSLVKSWTVDKRMLKGKGRSNGLPIELALDALDDYDNDTVRISKKRLCGFVKHLKVDKLGNLYAGGLIGGTGLRDLAAVALVPKVLANIKYGVIQEFACKLIGFQAILANESSFGTVPLSKVPKTYFHRRMNITIKPWQVCGGKVTYKCKRADGKRHAILELNDKGKGFTVFCYVGQWKKEDGLPFTVPSIKSAAKYLFLKWQKPL